MAKLSNAPGEGAAAAGEQQLNVDLPRGLIAYFDAAQTRVPLPKKLLIAVALHHISELTPHAIMDLLAEYQAWESGENAPPPPPDA